MGNKTTITLPFYLTQRVYFLEENAICDGTIEEINIKIELRGFASEIRTQYTVKRKNTYSFFGESEIFADKESLCQSLIKRFEES